MKRVAILLGDLHGDIHIINSVIEEIQKSGKYNPKFVLQAGDFGMYKDIPEFMEYVAGKFGFLLPVYAVHGNHEQEFIARQFMSELGYIFPNFKVFKEGGELITVEGVTILGIGGARSINFPQRIHDYKFDPDDYLIGELKANLKLEGRPLDVLLTHEAPYDVGLTHNLRVTLYYGLDPNRVLGDQTLRGVADRMCPKVQINGHHHQWNLKEMEKGWTHLTLPEPTDSGRYALLDLDTFEIIPVKYGSV
jgi:Icc-related predicted phosphoesterase